MRQTVPRSARRSYVELWCATALGFADHFASFRLVSGWNVQPASLAARTILAQVDVSTAATKTDTNVGLPALLVEQIEGALFFARGIMQLFFLLFPFRGKTTTK